jgi:tetratricopeptide (TPR) repeat protein
MDRRFCGCPQWIVKHATKDYILYLDADDVLLEKDQKKLKELKETLDPSVDSVSMYYDAGTDEFGNVTLRYRRNRLVKREKNFKWKGDCHQYLEVFGNIINADISVTHKKIRHSVGRNLNIYQKKIDRGDTFTPRDYFYYGNELRENRHYEKAIESYNKNIEMKEGWIEDKVYACINKADCHRFLGDLDNELRSLFQSFEFSKTPRAEHAQESAITFRGGGNTMPLSTGMSWRQHWCLIRINGASPIRHITLGTLTCKCVCATTI